MARAFGIGGVVVVVGLAINSPRAQAPEKPLAFEVASVKPNQSRACDRDSTLAGGRFAMTCSTLATHDEARELAVYELRSVGWPGPRIRMVNADCVGLRSAACSGFQVLRPDTSRDTGCRSLCCALSRIASQPKRVRSHRTSRHLRRGAAVRARSTDWWAECTGSRADRRFDLHGGSGSARFEARVRESARRCPCHRPRRAAHAGLT